MNNKKFMRAYHPGIILKEIYMKRLKLSMSKLAMCIQVSRKTISKITKGNGSITPEIAIKLSHAFDTTPNFWLNLQYDYDLWTIEHNDQDYGITKITF